MPLIQVKTFENELTDAQSEALIARITDVVAEITSDKLRDVTWVVIDQVRDRHWGVGGRALGLEDVKAIMAS